MSLEHWGFDHSPFTMQLSPSAAYPSTSLTEATARMEYLVQQHRRMGVLLGERGNGKSTTLACASEQLHRAGNAVAVVDVEGLSTYELLWELAAQLGTQPVSGEPVVQLWRRLTDQVIQNRWQQRPTVLMIDNVAEAGPDMLRALIRIARVDPAPEAQLTLFLTLQPTQLTMLPESLLHLIDLRIDLDPWEVDDTVGYLQQSLLEAGCLSPLFTDEALERLHTCTQGVPRHVARLADFALVAGAAAGADEIDARLVESAFQEIGWAPPVELTAQNSTQRSALV